ncbi:hypothetical protein Metal_1255 [Methylomicrobium album BG8]|uniref:Uncharacterized protein n=1 Tax=Methylomicrobium album BG8 TaxID=686340 RepID=H8GIM9_METAL|nr:hypothetical protein Metal_1255 [Methylomicrobium album BG8]
MTIGTASIANDAVRSSPHPTALPAPLEPRYRYRLTDCDRERFKRCCRELWKKLRGTPDFAVAAKAGGMLRVRILIVAVKAMDRGHAERDEQTEGDHDGLD